MIDRDDVYPLCAGASRLVIDDFDEIGYPAHPPVVDRLGAVARKPLTPTRPRGNLPPGN